MANARRGEVALCAGGRTYRLCLTLGALAELEEAFGAQDLCALAERFSNGRLSARDLIVILAHGLRGAGHEMDEEDAAALALDEGLAPVAKAVADLLVTTFGAGAQGEGEGVGEGAPNPPQAGKARAGPAA